MSNRASNYNFETSDYDNNYNQKFPRIDNNINVSSNRSIVMRLLFIVLLSVLIYLSYVKYVTSQKWTVMEIEQCWYKQQMVKDDFSLLLLALTAMVATSWLLH